VGFRADLNVVREGKISRPFQESNYNSSVCYPDTKYKTESNTVLFLIYTILLSVGTCNGLDGMEQDFLHLSRLALGPTQPPVQWVSGLFSGGKVAWAWH